ncbi:MAG: serine hydrolase domain-containing protein [Acidobacteriota bacterium]
MSSVASNSSPAVLDTSLDRTRAVLERGIADGLHFGGQVVVSRGASASATPRRATLAVGRSRVGGDDGVPSEITGDTLWIWLSSTKPVTAVAVGLLWQQDALGLDDPVVRFLPEFGAEGKDRITLRHLLTHTAGIRMLNLGWPEASWDEVIEAICRRRPEPRWEPGHKAGYHLASSWFILGEVVARVAGQSFPDFVRSALLEPLGMTSSWIGMPSEVYRNSQARIAHMYGTESGAGADQRLARGWHREPHVVGCSPGGNGHGPLRELALFYEMLLRRGDAASGRRLLTPQTVEAMTTPQRVGLRDLTFKATLDWGLGFITDSKHYLAGDGGRADDPAANLPYGYGRHASRRTFGHSGFQSSTAFADPEHDLVVVAAVNGQPGEERHRRRFRHLAEAIYEDLGLAASSAGR